MSESDSIWQQMLAKRAEWVAEQPSISAELKAMGREAIKDVRGTLHETFFGQPEHMSEMGTPLNPTPQMTTATPISELTDARALASSVLLQVY